MRITKATNNCHDIHVNFKNGDVFYFLLSADHHWDNPDSNRDMILRHLKQAKERNAKVIIVGDFFCAMQGKYDKRSDKSKVRPEHNNSRYLDSLVQTAADWLMPYREQIAVIGYGNHETSILKKHETDLIDRLVDKLNTGVAEGGWIVQKGGYTGYVRIRFYIPYKESAVGSLVIKYRHGHGGGGPVTQGHIQSQRDAVLFDDADIVISGHVHEKYLVTYMKEKLTTGGRVVAKEQTHVRIPTYKDEYKQGEGGWHVETGKPPKPIGAWWLMLEPKRVNTNGRIAAFQCDYNFLSAK